MSRFTMFTLFSLLTLSACSITTHPSQTAQLGQISSSSAMEAVLEKTGTVQLQTIHSADWSVPLSGLINLKHETAKQAGLNDREEAIHIDAHVLHHPKFGHFLIDTGVAQSLVDDPKAAGLSWMMRKGMGIEKIKMRNSTANIIKQLGAPLQGVFFTHLHIDHISGMSDIPNYVPLYIGKAEASAKNFMNVFVQGSTDALLKNKAVLQEWNFAESAIQSEGLSGVIDIFGDASVFAISVPGHTQGSTAYLVRTTQGPVLITGDTCHTRWGWENAVEPGDYTRDQESNRRSLLALKALVARHPNIQVRLGHQ
jgi:N-acyl homoserine lactone hydrolase